MCSRLEVMAKGEGEMVRKRDSAPARIAFRRGRVQIFLRARQGKKRLIWLHVRDSTNQPGLT